MLAYLIFGNMYLLKGYYVFWNLIDAKESSLTQLIFLIACRNILSRWRLLFAMGTVEVDYHFPLLP
jgi:hypothetical protein